MPTNGSTLMARQLLICCLAVWLGSAYSAKPKQGDVKDWMADLRSIPKPTIDATGKYKTYSKNYVRSDPVTGRYTRLSYNCTYADDHFVNLDDGIFSIKNVTCVGSKLHIFTTTRRGLKELAHAMSHSHTGLLYGGVGRVCPGLDGGRPGTIYR
jgi:hypothetical protein